MKYIIVICTLLASSFAFVAEEHEEHFEINGDYIESDFLEFDERSRSLEQDRFIGDGEIVAVVNKFADQILRNIGVLARRGGVDPMPLSGFDDNFLVARVKLSEGELDGVSSIERNGDVAVIYRSSKKLIVECPIKFDHIKFKYQFYVFLILIGHTGHLNGGIDSLKMNVEITIDLNTYKTSLTKLNMMDSGHVSVHVDGGVIEAVLTILSELVTTIIHPIIVAVIQEIVRSVLTGVINNINDGVDHILHPNATTSIF